MTIRVFIERVGTVVTYHPVGDADQKDRHEEEDGCLQRWQLYDIN